MPLRSLYGSRPRSRFVAEPVDGLSRRAVVAAACACCATSLIGAHPSFAAGSVVPTPTRPIHAQLNVEAAAIEARMIGWRQDIHQHPELGNQETRTAGIVASHLRTLGYEIREHVAVTGIVATLQGGLRGPVVAIRADMDALPVEEPAGLPFASRTRATWDDQDVDVMHACGHDCHTAILMAVAEILVAHREHLRGTVKLIFQPAEENLASGEIGGARRMIAEGAFADPKPEVVFALHMIPALTTGTLGYHPGRHMASSDEFRIEVTGRQTHAAYPWRGVDPIVVSAEIVTALQSIESRQVDVTEPSVLTVATIVGGNRANIIPDKVVMTGTVRSLSEDRRSFMKQRVQEVTTAIAGGMDATASTFWMPNGYPVAVNDPDLTERMIPSLARVVGPEKVLLGPPSMATEDFSYFAQLAPAFFFRVGITPPGQDAAHAAPNHSPRFMVDQASLLVGLRAMLHLVIDYTRTEWT